MAIPAYILNNNDILKARVACLCGDQLAITVLGYRVANKAGTGATLQDCATTIDNQIHAAYKSIMSEEALYRGVGVVRVDPLPTLEAVEVAHAGVGGETGPVLPRQVTGMFTKVSGLPGPAGRGRVYAPFPAKSADSATGVPSAGYMTVLGGLAGVLKATITAGAGGNTCDLVPVILRRSNYALSLAWPNATARAKWATQKRRGSYGKPNQLPF